MGFNSGFKGLMCHSTCLSHLHDKEFSWYTNKCNVLFKQAAYQDNTLGLPKICPEANLSKIDREVLFTYLKNHYTPKRMVVAGVGVDHGALVESVQKYFVDMKPIWEEDPDLPVPTLDMQVDKSIAQYTGGIVQVRLFTHVHVENVTENSEWSERHYNTIM